MLRHYLLMTVRTLTRHRLYTFINIAGLSVALGCAILIVLFVRAEVSYDRWIPDAAHLYRVELTFHGPGRDPVQLAQVPFPLVRVMREEIPEVRRAITVTPEKMAVAVGDSRFLETATVVSADFFQTIRLPLERGDAATALMQPESIVLSQALAYKFFGNVDPLGKIVRLSAADGSACEPSDAECLSATHPLKVTGVLRQLPADTHLQLDLLLPDTSKADQVPLRLKQDGWLGTQGAYGYVRLADGTDPQAVLAKLRPILDRSVRPQKLGINVPGSELEQFRLTPFLDVHLTTDNFGGMKPPGSRTAVYGFAVIAFLIVLLACFNFMNLATARATLRAREIGLRKVVGARRPQLIAQFLAEATLIALISMVFAIALVEVLTPAYASFLNRPLGLHPLEDWTVLLGILAGTIVAGLLSGAYPALVLSAFRPALVLKMSATSTQSGAGWLRTGLVIAQFAVSIALGVAAVVVFRQIEFARHVQLGFDREGVIAITGMTKLTPSARESFVRALTANPHIEAASLSNAVPFFSQGVSNVVIGIEGGTQSFSAQIFNIGPGFPGVYGLRVLAGRALSTAYAEDILPDRPSSNVLLNAEAARRFGLSAEQALGKNVTIFGHPLRIVGVLGDSLFDGMKGPVAPTVYMHSPDSDQNTLLSVRVRAGELSEAVDFLDRTWRSFASDTPMQRRFITDAFDGLFEADRRQGTMLAVFVGIAIFIACLGLFGLAVFTAARRTKEIGVRKVFGARSAQLVRLLLWQISVPVLWANVIAWPVAYYYLRQWLEAYAYRISLSPLYFVGAGVLTLVIACGSVLAHTVHLARATPVRALRYE